MRSKNPEKTIPVAILGATGSVGQRFVQLLDNHPWFKVIALTGSERTVGKKYGDACRWVLSDEMPEWAKEMVISPSTVEEIKSQIVFSALPSKHAGSIEPEFAKNGVYVCSNAGAFRGEQDVPVLLPEVNPSHLQVIDIQKRKRGWSGAIITNPNCTSTGLAIALKALDDAFGVDKGFVVSLQAISGAGYPGVPTFDIIDNVIPYIDGEEQKLEWEPRKILGQYHQGLIEPSSMKLSAQCNRVAVSDGHMICLSVGLKNLPEKENLIRNVESALKSYGMPENVKTLPSAPNPVINLMQAKDRPQPRLDRGVGAGMTTSIGRLREDPLLDVKMVILTHNTIRGAAGGSIFNAELLVKAGYLS